MSLPRPNESYHFQVNLIWWDSPFNLTPLVKDYEDDMLLFLSRYLNILFGRQNFFFKNEKILHE
jgi:hypothetical protein